METNEKDFVKSVRKQNWLFLIIEVIILVFFVGVTYARINNIEANTSENREAIKENVVRIEMKASKEDVRELKLELKDYNKEMKEDLLKAIDDLKREVRSLKQK